jgi:transposase
MTTTIGSDEHVERSVVAPPPLLLMAMELGKYEWKVGFTTGLGQRPRRRTIRTDHWQRLADEITTAKHRLGLAPDAPVTSCYEAGPDGFWVHRYLTTLGATNLVVDSSSIEVSRRARRAKTDRVDVERLLALLLRYTTGERTALRVVRVPGEDDEQRRQLHRELRTLLTERRRVINRVTGLLLTQSIRVKITGHFPERLPALRQWDGQPLSPAFRTRVEREWEKLELVMQQTRQLEAIRTGAVRDLRCTDRSVVMVRRLLELRGLGEASAWLFVMEMFAWRQFTNRRQIGAVTGLAPTPYQSGTLDREQGISKAGNRTVRTIAVQIAWIWVRYQRDSALTQWYLTRFANGGPRARKIGIVALARRLLIDLWRYLDAGIVPAGAAFRIGRARAGRSRVA